MNTATRHDAATPCEIADTELLFTYYVNAAADAVRQRLDHAVRRAVEVVLGRSNAA